MKKSIRIAVALLAVLMTVPAFAGCSHTHRFGDWITDAESHSRSCTVGKCTETESGVHNIGEGTVLVEAGPVSEGLKEYRCADCGYTFTEVIPQRLSLTIEEFSEFDTHTSLQKKYLASPVADVPDKAVGELEQSTQGTPVFTWHLEGLAEGEELVNYLLSISEKEDMSDAKTYRSRYWQYDRTGGFNFKVRTDYYWQVTASVKLADGTEVETKSAVSTFRTLDGPRTLDVGGIANFRDLGGKDADGGVLRQGLIFRCGRLNPNYSKSSSVSAYGKTMLIELGIKSEIDLRGAINDSGYYQNGFKADGSETMHSWGGDQINYYLCPAIYYDSILNNEDGKKMVKDSFAILADPDNYPLIFHCSIGTDRTGILAFLIEGICGVSYSDMERDYLFSNFANIGSSRSESKFLAVTSPVRSQKGSNYMEKCMNYLRSIGVTDEQIESVRNILIEKS
ncbi:MAG: tyrosine-protein phosphatase [Clostridia bacterium]|nr:tyrosine-protein phosphatase [Clostridia bacterium]MBP5173652.1 tyrosine-protein phosphatase [Clostridia bacterium]